MKHLVILSDESVLAGCVKCGMAQIVDSLAVSMTNQYQVSLVCPAGNYKYMETMGEIVQRQDGIKTCRMLNVVYYMIDQSEWSARAPAVVDGLRPDVLHNFACPTMAEQLQSRPAKMILTFDNARTLELYSDYLSTYDYVTTISKTYANEINAVLNDGISTYGRSATHISVTGLDTGILTDVITPEKGVLLKAKFSAVSLDGRDVCQDYFRRVYGIADDVCIYGMMCRLIEEKGLDNVLAHTNCIKERGGILIIVGRGSRKYEEQLSKMTRQDGVIWIKKWASPVQAAPFMAGIDFYLSPSTHESCGLMPMTAAQYGAIPIVTRVGSMGENFNNDNAIIVEGGSLASAIEQASNLYHDKHALTTKRKACMINDFGWNTRKQGYIEVYEG